MEAFLTRGKSFKVNLQKPSNPTNKNSFAPLLHMVIAWKLEKKNRNKYTTNNLFKHSWTKVNWTKPVMFYIISLWTKHDPELHWEPKRVRK